MEYKFAFSPDTIDIMVKYAAKQGIVATTEETENVGLLGQIIFLVTDKKGYDYFKSQGFVANGELGKR